MHEVNKSTWKLKFGSSSVQIRDAVNPVLGIVSRANSFISSSVSANPYASLAWMGVSILLPLFLNPSEQLASLVSGLDHISSLITQSWMWEDLYLRRYESLAGTQRSSTPSHTAYKKALEELYRHILKFQITGYCYYTQNSAFRLGLDIVKWNAWDALLNDIKTKESAFTAVRDIWKDNRFDEECVISASRHEEAMRQWRDIGTCVSEFREAVKAAQEEESRKKLLLWLCNVDPSDIYNVARDRYESGTCEWLVKDSVEFTTWKSSPSSVLWLHGKPGCGKSVLSSSVVQHLAQRYVCDPGSPIAYFFFSFSDREKQKVDTMLSSLIKQLCVSRPDTPQLVRNLDTLYQQKGLRPDTRTLEDTLLVTAQGFSSVSLIIDALDECPEFNGERTKLLTSLTRIISQMPDNLHIFFTSRAEPDISATMNSILTQPMHSKVAIDLTSNGKGINHDIKIYINSRLASGNPASWPDNIKAKAKGLLLLRADGMFQYIVCQFQELEKLNSAAEINEALEKLPLGLGATYERILQNIDPRFQAQVVNMLKWLIASIRPLLLDELSETWIIRPEDPVPFKQTCRLFKPLDCIKYIPNLVIVETRCGHYHDGKRQREPANYVRLAHFSIKEYLTSGRPTNRRTRAFFFTEIKAHLDVAHLSLVSTLYCSTLVDRDVDFKLKSYMIHYWALHLESVPFESWPESLVNLARCALALGSNSLRLMIQEAHHLYSADPLGHGELYYKLQRPYCSTIERKLLKLTEMLLPGGPWANTLLGDRDIDEALYYAARQGNIEIVRFLLERSVYANRNSKILERAMKVAVQEHHKVVLKFLLHYTVNINISNFNAQHGSFKWAICTAASSCRSDLLECFTQLLENYAHGWGRCSLHSTDCLLVTVLDEWLNVHGRRCQEVVQFLLDGGVNVNSQNSTGETALCAAARNIPVQQESFYFLLERGAEINARGGRYETALQAACTHKDASALVAFLLEKGADVNIQGGEYGNALQAACSQDDLDTVHLLLDHGAEIVTQGGPFGRRIGCQGSPLQTACYFSNADMAKLLTDRGADVNAQGGYYGTALQAACHFGNTEVMKLLTGREVDINVQGGYHGTALQAACYRDDINMAKLLIDEGANVNAQGGHYGNALQAVATRTEWNAGMKLASLLLRNGADINQIGGEYGTALQAACENPGRIDMVRLFLNHGVDVNAHGGKYGTALQAACMNTDLGVVRLLIDYGADIHVQGGHFGSAWHAASFMRISYTTSNCGTHLDIHELQKLLLDCGADINSKQVTQHGTALQGCLEYGIDNPHRQWFDKEEDVVIDQIRFLVENGADVNIHAGKHGFPLQSACANRYSSRAMYFLQHYSGLDLNAIGGVFGTALQAAAHSGHTDVVELLLQKGAEPNAGGGRYRSALNAAVFRGRWHIVEILLKYGAVSDRERLQEPDEEWLTGMKTEILDDLDYEHTMYNKIYGEMDGKAYGEAAVERYRIFWERQSLMNVPPKLCL